MRSCTVCISESRLGVERALLQGIPLRQIGARYSLSAPALCRHNRAHLPPALAQGKDARDAVRVKSILDDLFELVERVRALGAKAKKSGDIRAALLATREEARLLELRFKIAEIITSDPRVLGSETASVKDVTFNQLNAVLEQDPEMVIRAARAKLQGFGYQVIPGNAVSHDAV
jgi:hypothetical protein